ncbi:MAG: hypothetical protein ACE5JX_12490 [Acidobacteriota bacterium]
MIEIACPSDCRYLTSGQSYQLQKKYLARLTGEEDPRQQRKFLETTGKFAPVLAGLETRIVEYAAGLRSLSDQDVLRAVGLLRETYRTEEKGVIYEHPSSNPLVQALFRDLYRFLEEGRQNQKDALRHLEIADILDTLEVLEKDIRFHLLGDSDTINYLRFIKKSHPEAARGPAEGGLITP